MRIIASSYFLFFVTVLFGQLERECILIDFETLPNNNPFEGLALSGEYRDSFGLYFELEGGGVPVIARVGNPITAFGSDYGSDMPAPNQGIGQYFLTDDGILSGLISPPIIVRFDNPIDTFSGCILDMDFDETFIIHARDKNDQIMLADTIRAGDPGTGDGIATCWGFNLPSCSGSVYSVRFEGRRQQSGSFGMGLDNLSFCTGVDINSQISATTTATTCTGLFSGTINIINEGPQTYQFSINNGIFQTEPIFEDLTAGEHLISLLDSTGCIESFNVFIDGPLPLIFSDVVNVHTTCAEDNGSLHIFTSVQEGITYSIDGMTFQNSPVFSSLSPTTYNVFVKDSFGCLFQSETRILPSELPIIQSLDITEDYCGEGRGVLEINASGGKGQFEYKLNNQLFQLNSGFTNLTSGLYIASIKDEDDCLVSDSVFIPATPKVKVNHIEITQPICNERHGSIEVNGNGGTGLLEYSIDDHFPQSDSFFTNLPSGIYQINVLDIYGCKDSALAEIKAPRCPVYVPNIITPNDDGHNDFFQLRANIDYTIGIICYRIYDRWGELVYKSSNFSIHENGHWWDGKFKGTPAESGVYVYVIDVLHENGDSEVLKGDVTLLR